MKKINRKTYTPPCNSGYTIYGINGCKYCNSAKELIKEKGKICKVINCDDYISSLRERDAFYTYISKYTKDKAYIYFPMIFNDKKFIGGYKELMVHLGVKMT